MLWSRGKDSLRKLSVESEGFLERAIQFDRIDPLAKSRSKFHIPTRSEITRCMDMKC